MSSSDTLPPIPDGLKDLTAQTFGNLRVISRATNYEGRKYREACWLVQCVRCGRSYDKPMRGSTLRGGRATGKKCSGCKPERTDGPRIVVDRDFVEHWTSLINTSIGKVIGFGALYNQNRADIVQDTFINLSQVKDSISEKALSTFVWNVAKYRAINFLQHIFTTKFNPTLTGTEDYCDFVLDSLTTDEEPLCLDEKLLAMREAFDSLTDEERKFCEGYFADTRFKSGSDQQRMNDIRDRLKQRVAEIEQRGVYAQ